MDKLIPEPEGVQLQELERVTNLQAQWIIGDKKLIYECNVKGDFEKKFLLDMEMLKRIMHHLLSNAVKFTPAGGNVEVQIDLQTDPVSEVCRLVISVEDTGCGVEAGKEELIFEPFRQADLSNTRAHGGVGLGLANCAKYAGATKWAGTTCAGAKWRGLFSNGDTCWVRRHY